MFVSAFPVGLTTCRHIFVFRRKNFYSPYTIPQARDESKQKFRKIDFGNMQRYITQAVHMRKTQDAYLLSLPYRSHIVSQDESFIYFLSTIANIFVLSLLVFPHNYTIMQENTAFPLVVRKTSWSSAHETALQAPVCCAILKLQKVVLARCAMPKTTKNSTGLLCYIESRCWK